MGCVQAKPSLGSPHRGVEKMKIDHAYIPSSDVSDDSQRPPARAAAKPSSRPVPAAADDGARARARARAGGGDAGDEDHSVVTLEGEREGKMLSQRAPRVAAPPPPPPRAKDSDELVEGWPRWLTDNIPWNVLSGLVPKSADAYDKLDKIGQGTYSNVYKARERDTGKIVALKKVRFDTSESESVRFMAREIMILQRLDHPNVIKLEGLATSRMQYSLYLVFDFMQTDLARVICRPDARLTEPQVKCYMQQLLSGLQHCHERGILHRDIKGSNLLIDRNGMLKIGDFGLANYFNPNSKRPLTSRVVTLWYRAPELLLGTTDYGVGIDLWSAGCLLAEMFAGRPIMPGRTEVEQLHRIFKLCGSPSEEYWRKLKLSTSFRPPQPYKPSILESFRDFPSSSMGLLTALLALDPSYRGTAASALENEFFSTSPLACELSGLPVIYRAVNDESNQNRERRKRKKLKHRSRTQREGQIKMEQDMAKTRGDSGSSKEEKASDASTRSPELGSSTGSTSSSVKPKRYFVSSPPCLSPVASPFVKPSRRSEAHPSATRNIKNLPSTSSSIKDNRVKKEGIENKHWHGLEKRSSSTSAFRRFEEKEIPKQYVLVD